MIVSLISLVVVLGSAVWVFMDAGKRGMSAIGWALGVFILWIIFFPLYFILRKPAIL